MNPRSLYRFGQFTSIVLWLAVIYGLININDDKFAFALVLIGAVTLVAHIAEILIFFVFGPLKPLMTTENVIKTLLFGVFHINWLKANV